MNREQFMATCHIIQKRNPQWRWGQTVVNVAINELTQKAMPLVGTDIDCFYDNDLIPTFLNALFPQATCVRTDCPVCGGPES